MKFIAPSAVSGDVFAPASKSVAIRAIAAATLASGGSTLAGRFDALDIQAALGIARALGSSVEARENRVVITPGRRPDHLRFDAGESALCQRLFSVIASLTGGPHVVNSQGSLRGRPADVLARTLQPFGVEVDADTSRGALTIRGTLRPGNSTVDGSLSSQVISGLLMSLPLLSESSLLRVTDLTSMPYLELTCEVLRAFGVRVSFDRGSCSFAIPGGQRYQGVTFDVESDWSGAAAFLVAGAIAGEVTVRGLRPDSRQGDRRIVQILQQAGAFVASSSTSIEVRRAPLCAVQCDLTDIPDLLPVLTVLALHGDGPSVFSGIGRLRHKESDRPGVLVAELTALGARLEASPDRLVVYPGVPMGGRASTHGDHRIAMALGLVGLRSGRGVSLADDSCVAKSYPSFFEDLGRIMVATKRPLA